ncbi:MAG: sodium:solute symporter [Muribaculaceae bacterium]
MIIAIVILYFALLYAVSRFTSRHEGNDTFFSAKRQSPWYMVAFGMIGASISGISFVSVPGMVMSSQMTYLQTCLGFILGYAIVAFVLLPLYYRLNLTTIYSYLGQRLGRQSYLTGASIFIAGKIIGAALKFYVVCMILQEFVFSPMGVPFPVTVTTMVALIWLYTRRGGIRTLVFTDTLQTACMLAALALITFNVMQALNFTPAQAINAISQHPMSQVFVFNDWLSPQNFWKQFVSGAFIVIVMTGLDQDMMQKNLTCRNLRDAQKDMCSYALAFVPVNLLFLALGVLLVMLCEQLQLQLPASSDSLLSMFAATGRLGTPTLLLFTLGIVAASFSSADSALTSLTTSYCIDLRCKPHDERLRRRTHLTMCAIFVACILLFKYVNSTSLIDAIYTIVSYTYGPLLGLFAFAIFTRRTPKRYVAPIAAITAPVICFVASRISSSAWGYHFGYELLLLNGMFTFVILFTFSNALEYKTK